MKFHQYLTGHRLYIILIHITLLVFVSQVVILSMKNRELRKKQTAAEPLAIGDSFSFENVDPLSSDASLDFSKPQLLFIFSTTCKYCHENMSRWNRVAELADEKEISIVGISVHSFEKTKAYIQENRVDFPVYWVRDQRKFGKENKLRGVPTTILLNKNREIQEILLGVLSEDKVRELTRTESLQLSMN